MEIVKLLLPTLLLFASFVIVSDASSSCTLGYCSCAASAPECTCNMACFCDSTIFSTCSCSVIQHFCTATGTDSFCDKNGCLVQNVNQSCTSSNQGCKCDGIGCLCDSSGCKPNSAANTCTGAGGTCSCQGAGCLCTGRGCFAIGITDTCTGSNCGCTNGDCFCGTYGCLPSSLQSQCSTSQCFCLGDTCSCGFLDDYCLNNTANCVGSGCVTQYPCPAYYILLNIRLYGFNNHLTQLAKALYIAENLNPVSQIPDISRYSLIVGCTHFDLSRYFEFPSNCIFSKTQGFPLLPPSALTDPVPAFYRSDLNDKNEFCYYPPFTPHPNPLRVPLPSPSIETFTNSIQVWLDANTSNSFQYETIGLPFIYDQSMNEATLTQYIQKIQILPQWLDLSFQLMDTLFGPGDRNFIAIQPGAKLSECFRTSPKNLDYSKYCREDLQTIMSQTYAAGWLPPTTPLQRIYVAFYNPRLHKDVSYLISILGAKTYVGAFSDYDRVVIEMGVCIHAAYFIGNEDSEYAKNIVRYRAAFQPASSTILQPN